MISNHLNKREKELAFDNITDSKYNNGVNMVCDSNLEQTEKSTLLPFTSNNEHETRTTDSNQANSANENINKNKPFMLTKGSNKKKNISSNIISSLNPKNLFTVSNEIVSKFEKKKKPFKANNQVNTKLNNESPETLESTITTTTSVSNSNDSQASFKVSNKQKNVCLIQESPFYIHKIAQTGRLDDFKRLYNEDPKRLNLRDNVKKWLPIHHAAFKGKENIMQFIIERERTNLNEQDSNGNTPLHLAIQYGHAESVKFLLKNGANTTILNKSNHAPIHQCVLSQKPDILRILLDDPNVDIHLGGELGASALHYCAYYDNLDCAKVLFEYKTNMCIPCKNGFFPIHVAAHRCSNKVLEYLISEGSKKGCSKLKMLSFVDGDNNKPLHAAVQFGNIGAVKLCLENGSSIEEVTEMELSTPVHIACSQGSLEILKLMAEKQPDTFLEVINSHDAAQMTPLHKAAMFDHVDIANYLIDQGAYIDSLDKEKRSPLLLAAFRSCSKMINFLIKRGANVHLKDLKSQNLLHLIVNQNSKPAEQAFQIEKTYGSQKNASKYILDLLAEGIIQSCDFFELLKEKDDDGCTVVHYICKFGYANCLKTLMEKGANISTRNNDKQSPYHYAAKYGRYSSCFHLLNSENYKNHINEKDGNGLTPLHLAAQNGHVRVVELLMQKGALVYKSFTGNNPFHEAALNGFTNCMKIIYNNDPYILNSENKQKDTALHMASKEGHAKVIEFLLDNQVQFKFNKDELSFIDLAIIYKQRSVLRAIIAHQRWQEALDLTSKPFKTPLIGIIQMCSKMTYLVLERCVTKSTNGVNATLHPSIHYNFKYLNWTEERIEANGRTSYAPMLPLTMMVNFNRTECLSHPLCECLLQRKWLRYGLPIYGISTFLYVIYLMILTTLVVLNPTCYQYTKTTQYIQNLTSCNHFIESLIYVKFYDETLFMILSLFALIFSIANIFKEILQIVFEKSEYFKNFQSYIQLLLYPLSMLFILPFIINNIYSAHGQWEIGALTIFLAWFNLLLFMQRFYIFGIYVVMFIEILKTLFKVITLFSILIIGFGLVFFILLGNSENKANMSPIISIIRTIIMMVGDIDGLDSFIIPFTNHSLRFGTMSIMFLVLFVFLIPILLTNLLIGLAVGDIESVQRNAQLKREAMQVHLHVELERKMPRKLLEKVNEMEYELRLTDCTNTFDCIKKQLWGHVFPKIKTENSENDNQNSELVIFEIFKQKDRMSQMKKQMEKQTEFLRLIAQKMEIKYEDEYTDDEDITYGKPKLQRKSNEFNNSTLESRLKSIVVKSLMLPKN